MAINRKTIDHILRYLEGEIKIIADSHVTREALNEEENLIFTDATKHRIQVAIEMVINIAEHIVSGLNLGMPEYARDLFPLLDKKNIITEDLSERLGKAVGLRNVLVHMYLEVDLDILTESANVGLDDLREFVRAINEFLEKQK
ncbi:MAG: DUF86 domain-containing protein [Candidatus Daviesbacteria bacterium]|nr:MAG: DUF86 domain-containing protein [Candidatus Daviesbacteria bacterium]